MTHYTMSYKGLSQEEADKKAIHDSKEFVDNEEQWAKILEYVEACESLEGLQIGLSFTGIRGYPVYALCRVYNPKLLGTTISIPKG